MVKNKDLTISGSFSGLPQRDVVVLVGEILADVFPDRTVLGGAPFNVARHLQAFGLCPLLITRVGNDKLGEELLACMIRMGMTTAGVQQDSVHQTGQVIVQIEAEGHTFHIPSDQAYDFIQSEEACRLVLSASPELIYFGTLAQRHRVSRQSLNEMLRNTRIPRVLDINLREPWYTRQIIEDSLHHADIVKMSEGELETIARLLHVSGNSAHEQAASIIQLFSLERLLVTCGAQGAWQLDAAGEKCHQQGAANTRVVDSVGAGDGFTAVFITGTLRGWSKTLTLSRANAFAAALCGIRGAVPANQAFYHSFLDEWGE